MTHDEVQRNLADLRERGYLPSAPKLSDKRLKELEAAGFFARNPDGTYQISWADWCRAQGKWP